ncbi:unnamed protein product [Musa textilis]
MHSKAPKVIVAGLEQRFCQQCSRRSNCRSVVGRHQEATLKSEKPKLFIMGTEDGFTSVNQLQNKLKSAARQSRQPPDRRSWPFFRWSISYPHLLNPCRDSSWTQQL